MRAANASIDVTFEVDDKDFYVVADDVTVTQASEISDKVTGVVTNIVAYDGDLKYVNKDLAGVSFEVEVYLYTDNSVDLVYSGDYNVAAIEQAVTGKLSDGDEIAIVFYPTIDYVKNGAAYDPTKKIQQDGTDDREQTVVTIKEEVWSDRKGSGTGEFTSDKYVADDDDTLESLIESLNNYGKSHRVGSGRDRKEYNLVYYVDGETVTGYWEVAEDSKIVWNKKSNNELDTNGDGKISCDEYYKTTGLVWSDEKNACVVESNGAVVVTIPNTATK